MASLKGFNRHHIHLFNVVDDEVTYEDIPRTITAIQWALQEIERLNDEVALLRGGEPTKSASAKSPVPPVDHPAKATTEAAETKPAGIPFMITGRMKRELAKRGHKPAEIRKMTPAQAHQILGPTD